MGLGANVEDCIVLFHPDHKRDYFTFAIRVAHRGSSAIISIDGFGRSKLMKADESRQRMEENAKGYLKEAVFGKCISQDMVHCLANAIGSAGFGLGWELSQEQKPSWKKKQIGTQ